MNEISIEMLNECLSNEDFYKLGGKLICSDTFGYELWDFGNEKNPLYAQRHINMFKDGRDRWSSRVEDLYAWFILKEDDEWVEQRLK